MCRTDVSELARARCGDGESPACVDEGAGNWMCGGAAGDVVSFCGKEWGYRCWVGGSEGDDGEWTGPEAGG